MDPNNIAMFDGRVTVWGLMFTCQMREPGNETSPQRIVGIKTKIKMADEVKCSLFGCYY